MSDERARLFVALELPQPIRQALVDWRASAVRGVDGLRLVRPDDLHVTMCFLGWRAIGEIESIVSACRVLATEPVAQLRVGGSIWLPPRRPRVLAVELDDRGGLLAAAQSRLSAALEARRVVPAREAAVPRARNGRPGASGCEGASGSAGGAAGAGADGVEGDAVSVAAVAGGSAV